VKDNSDAGTRNRGEGVRKSSPICFHTMSCVEYLGKDPFLIQCSEASQLATFTLDHTGALS